MLFEKLYHLRQPDCSTGKPSRVTLQVVAINRPNVCVLNVEVIWVRAWIVVSHTLVLLLADEVVDIKRVVVVVRIRCEGGALLDGGAAVGGREGCAHYRIVA